MGRADYKGPPVTKPNSIRGCNLKERKKNKSMLLPLITFKRPKEEIIQGLMSVSLGPQYIGRVILPEGQKKQKKIPL